MIQRADKTKVWAVRMMEEIRNRLAGRWGSGWDRHLSREVVQAVLFAEGASIIANWDECVGGKAVESLRALQEESVK